MLDLLSGARRPRWFDFLLMERPWLPKDRGAAKELYSTQDVQLAAVWLQAVRRQGPLLRQGISSAHQTYCHVRLGRVRLHSLKCCSTFVHRNLALNYSIPVLPNSARTGYSQPCGSRISGRQAVGSFSLTFLAISTAKTGVEHVQHSIFFKVLPGEMP